jgi:hypothetical protein
MPETQRGVKLDFGNRLEIGFRDFLEAEETYRIRYGRFRRVALEAKRIPSGPCLRLELRGMCFMADKALTVLIGTMKHAVFPGLVTLGTEVAARGEQGDRCFVFFRDDLVAVLATHSNCRVDELAFFFLGMAG